jgi:hypothetical protein
VRQSDLDPFYTLFDIKAFAVPDRPSLTPPILNDAVWLIDAGWSAESVRPGDVAESVTVWQVADAARLGLIHPPTFKTELNHFTHVLYPDGTIFLQQDRLDAPSWDWQTGDTVVQIHQFAIPPDAPAGQYAVVAGLYDRITGERLLTQDGADHVSLGPLVIQN